MVQRMDKNQSTAAPDSDPEAQPAPKGDVALAGAGGRKAAVQAALRRQILTLERAPGSAIDEASVAKEYGLSRPPLREVLRQMAGEGYLELRPNRGAVVAPMDYGTLRHFFLVAPMIYSAVARLAAQNATPAQIASLKEIQRNFVAAIRDGSVEDRTFWNDRFHATTGEMADDVYLMPSLRRLLIDHARIGMTFYRPRNGDTDARLVKAAEQHDQIIAAIEAGDEAAAANAADDHWKLSRDRIETFVMPSALEVPLGTEPGARNNGES